MKNLRSAALLAWLSAVLFLAAAAWPSFSGGPIPLLGLRNLGTPIIGWPLAVTTLVLAAALSLRPLWTRDRLLACAGFCTALALVVFVYAAMALAPLFLLLERWLRQAAREGEPRAPEGALVPGPSAPVEPGTAELAASRKGPASLGWLAAVAFLAAAAWPRFFHGPFPLPGLRQLAQPGIGWPLTITTVVLAAALGVPRLWKRDRLVACGGFCLGLFAIAAFYASPGAAVPFVVMSRPLLRAGKQPPRPGAPAPARA